LPRNLFAESVATFNELIALMKKLFLIIFISGALIRFGDAWRPINQTSWRAADLGMIARNFDRNGMNLFYPQIDWGGQTAGYVEMEFPIYPYLTAISYKIFGFNEINFRLISFFFSLGTLFFFYKLSASFLDEIGSFAAFTFFTFHPLFFEISTSIQPEGLMLMLYIASVYCFKTWLEKDTAKHFASALISTAFLLSAKATSAHIGIFFGILLYRKYGLLLFKQTKVWIFGFVLLPAIAWYIHAKSFWLTYGNSLGVSNEYHWIGWDFFTNPYFIRGIFGIEFTSVWLIFGFFVGGFAVWKGWSAKPVRFCLLWLTAIFVLYFVAARTTADTWAIYYHAFSLAPAALLFGFAAEKIFDAGKIAKIFVIVLIACAFLFEAKQIRRSFLDHRVYDDKFYCAKEFKPLMKNIGLTAASGGNCFDDDGYILAYNSSYFLYWLDRKGFNVCVEDLKIERIKELKSKGVKYFVAEKEQIAKKPDFEEELREVFTVVSECRDAILFDLESEK
jgi:4-amino-4-deoxy-L-arabinose transferase-like glycosyltransferase